jgi:methanogenic corrinoid protein MtbC1
MDKIIIQKFADLEEDQILELVHQEIDKGTDPQAILNACQDGLVIVGERFEKGEYFVSDLMMSGQMFKQVSELVKPLFKTGSGAKSSGKVVMGTVAGDIHDIGKDIVVGMLEANTFTVYDLGVDQNKSVFIEKLKETGAPVLALSGLLTVAFDSMKDTIEELKKAGLRDKVKVMIGGGPMNQSVCDYTGADGWGNSAQTAVKLCKQWISK